MGFSRRLKTGSDVANLISWRSLFQTEAAATTKARSPIVERRVAGMAIRLIICYCFRDDVRRDVKQLMHWTRIPCWAESDSISIPAMKSSKRVYVTDVRDVTGGLWDWVVSVAQLGSETFSTQLGSHLLIVTHAFFSINVHLFHRKLKQALSMWIVIRQLHVMVMYHKWKTLKQCKSTQRNIVQWTTYYIHIKTLSHD